MAIKRPLHKESLEIVQSQTVFKKDQHFQFLPKFKVVARIQKIQNFSEAFNKQSVLWKFKMVAILFSEVVPISKAT